VLDDRVAFREDGRNVQSFIRNSFSHTRNCLREIEHLDRAKQRFARVAAPVMTLSTDQTILNATERPADASFRTAATPPTPPPTTTTSNSLPAFIYPHFR
jgi:hypothetical protein